jgi:hypothetical protein
VNALDYARSASGDSAYTLLGKWRAVGVHGDSEGVLLVDPVTLSAVLLAIVSGAAGEAGSRLWAGVSALTRRPFRHGTGTGSSAIVSDPAHPALAATDIAIPASGGAVELAALERSPEDHDLALTLARVLLARADADGEFGRALGQWWEQACQVRTGDGDVSNTISGGTQHGPVFQGRDFSGLTFGAPPPAPPSHE